MTGVGMTPRRAVVAEDIRDFQRWTRHDCWLGDGSRFTPWPCLPVGLNVFERAFDTCDHAGRNPRVARRRLQLVVAQKRLNDADIGAAFQKMRCEGVTERMQAHGLLDAGGLGCLLKQAGELTRRQMIALAAPRKQPAFPGWDASIILGGPFRPLLPQQIEDLLLQHHVPVLAPLRLARPG